MAFSAEMQTDDCFCLRDLHLRSYLTFEMAWRSSLLCRDEWWPVCREHDTVLMLRWRCGWPELAVTYLLDLLGLPQLQEGGSKSPRTTVNLNCYPLGAYMQSSNTSTSPVWHQHQFSPHGQRLQEKVSRGCSHQAVWCILSAFSIYKGEKEHFLPVPNI